MKKLLSDMELAALTGRSRSAWQKDRFTSFPGSIPYIKCGRLVRYQEADVEAWLERNRVAAPAQSGGCQ
jgi:predicted DNA-binding transcriptional regulator AlpA